MTYIFYPCLLSRIPRVPSLKLLNIWVSLQTKEQFIEKATKMVETEVRQISFYFYLFFTAVKGSLIIMNYYCILFFIVFSILFFILFFFSRFFYVCFLFFFLSFFFFFSFFCSLIFHLIKIEAIFFCFQFYFHFIISFLMIFHFILFSSKSYFLFSILFLSQFGSNLTISISISILIPRSILTYPYHTACFFEEERETGCLSSS